MLQIMVNNYGEIIRSLNCITTTRVSKYDLKNYFKLSQIYTQKNRVIISGRL